MRRAINLGAGVAAIVAIAVVVASAQNRIDAVSPYAPELAAYGEHSVGVRTIVVIDHNRPDILHTANGQPTARADRALTLEVWYPAAADVSGASHEYRTILRDPSVPITLVGRAGRDLPPTATGAPFPLVVISHGYPGNRLLMSHLGENLASKGYVVAAIDHPESTYDDQKAFGSTLYNRPLDQRFAVDAIGALSAGASGSFLAGLVDVTRTAIVGYSMGGYGVLNVVGGAYRPAAASLPGAPPNQLLLEHTAGHAAFKARMDDTRIKAAVAIGPWGMPAGFWDATGLAGIRIPVLFVAGSADDVSGYETGTRAIFEAAVNADRFLLTYLNANHNAGAPIPAPVEAWTYSKTLTSFPFVHYADAVWDTTRMNNVLAHFATAFLDLRLKDVAARRAYLDVVPRGSDGVYAVDRDGAFQPTHTYWKGFKRATATGLVMEHRAAGEGGPAGDGVFKRLAPGQRESVPQWVVDAVGKAGMSDRFVIDPRLNPFLQHGDFDGDGRLDVALLVRAAGSTKTGVAILHRATGRVFLLGAGSPGARLGDDFTWMDAWSVFDKGPVEQGATDERPPILRGDALLLAKSESASGLLWWTGTTYRWYQQGD